MLCEMLSFLKSHSVKDLLHSQILSLCFLTSYVGTPQLSASIKATRDLQDKTTPVFPEYREARVNPSSLSLSLEREHTELCVCMCV